MSEEQLTILWHRIDRARLRYLPRMQALTIQALNESISPVLAALETGHSNADSLVLEYPIERLFIALYGTVGVGFARATFRQLVNNPPKEELVEELETKDRGHTITENVSPPNEQDGNWLRQMRRLGEQQTVKIKGITQTTKEWVANTLAKAQELGINGLTYLKEKWAEVVKKRALVISSVEIVAASNAGSLLGAKSSRLLINKTWASQRDGKVRASHRYMDGIAVGLDDLFSVSGYPMNHPADSSLGAPASEVINCRCFMTFEKKA